MQPAKELAGEVPRAKLSQAWLRIYHVLSLAGSDLESSHKLSICHFGCSSTESQRPSEDYSFSMT